MKNEINNFIYNHLELDNRIIINNNVIICDNNFKFILKYVNIYLFDMDLEYVSLLHNAIYENNLEIIEYLLENGVDIEIRDSFGESPIMLAFEYGKVIDLLLKYNPNLNAQDIDGNTTLIMMVDTRNTEAVEWLLELDVDINIKNNEGKTAKDYIKSNSMNKLFDDYGRKNNLLKKT